MGFPKTYTNIWYNCQKYIKDEYPIIWDKKDNYISAKIGLIVIMGELENGKKVYYKIVKIWRERPNSDWACDSDSIRCDLKFYKIC